MNRSRDLMGAGTFLTLLLSALGPGLALGAETRPQQLRTLGRADKPRFNVTDREWPQTPAAPSVCLWKDDKLAAFCFGVDDNWASEHDWWLAQQAKYGYPCTWFVISGRVGTGGLWGSWDAWRRLLAAGHDVQSHTVTHLHTDDPGYAGVEWDYAEAVVQLERNLPGHRVLALAYPGGRNGKMNSRELAAKYYVCARGTAGILNAPNRIDYLNINASRLHVGASPDAPWADARQLIDPDSRSFRGWGFYFTHQVERPAAIAVMEYLKAHDNDFWVGLMVDIARYGQERDTAVLSQVAVTDTSVTFLLSDDMHDTLFDLPLTVKVRLPANWTGASATQAGRAVDVRVLRHEDSPFALVQAVPDRGHVTVERTR